MIIGRLQSAILAQRDDVEMWINLLVIILFVVFAVLGKFLQSVGKKQRSPDGLNDENGHKSDRSYSDWEEKIFGSRQKPAPKPARKSQVEKKRSVRKKTVYGPTLGVQELPVQSASLPAVQSNAAKGESQEYMPAEIANILSELKTSQGLQKAVLYHEILGSPVGLRKEQGGF